MRVRRAERQSRQQGDPRVRRPLLLMIALSKVIAAAVLGGVLAWLWSTLRPPVYAATSTVLVSSSTPPGLEYEAARADASRATTLAALSVAPSRLAQAKADLHLTLPVADLGDQVSARNEVGSPFVTVTARSEQPGTAAALAYELARLMVADVPAPGDGPAMRLELVEPAQVPSQQEYTRPLRDVATGAFVGALAAIAIGVGRRRVVVRNPWRAAPGDATSILFGVALAVVIIAAMALGASEVVLQALTLFGAATAAVSVPAGLALIAIMLPLPDPGGFGALTLNLMVIGGICYGSLVARIDRRSLTPAGLGTIAVVGFVGLAAIASLPALNGFGSERAVASLTRGAQFAAGLLLVLAAAEYFTLNDSRRFLLLTVVSAAFAACLAIAELVVGNPASLPFHAILAPQEVVNLARPSGPFINANYFGLFVSLGLVAAVGIAVNQPGLRLAMALCMAPLILAVTVGSLSRGALLATSAGLLALVWLFARRRLALVASLAIIACVGLILPALVAIRTDRSGTGGTAAAIVGVAESDQERLDAVKAALPLFAIDPIFGVGFGQYHFESIRFVGSSPATSSHNQYLNLLAEQGLVGLTAFGAVLLALARALRRSWWAGSRIAVAMLATYAVAALFLEPFNTLQTSGILWIALAAGVAPAPHGVRARRGVLHKLGLGSSSPVREVRQNREPATGERPA